MLCVNENTEADTGRMSAAITSQNFAFLRTYEPQLDRLVAEQTI